jgi:hypothetical protein
MEVVPITPADDKVERLREHVRTIRRKRIQLRQGAPWYDDFISEATQFPYGPFDDQMDALSQYLNWIAEHPNLPRRPAMATMQGVDSQGRPIHPSPNVQSTQTKGIAVEHGRRMMPNAPFPHVKTWVVY